MLAPAASAAAPHLRSPLAERLSAYAPLDQGEHDALEQLQGEPLSLERGAELCREGEPSTTLFVLEAGALLASHRLPGGARQILRIHHPGDLMNTSCLGWARTAATLAAALPSTVRPVKRSDFGGLFRTQPRLAALCHGVSVADGVSLCDRLASIGRTSAMARTALLLLELHARQHVGADDPPPTLSLFLSQADIADATGMTKVHVNRVLRAMADDGLIQRDRREVRLLDRQQLVDMCGYVDRLTHVSVDWLPASAQGSAEFTR